MKKLILISLALVFLFSTLVLAEEPDYEWLLDSGTVETIVGEHLNNSGSVEVAGKIGNGRDFESSVTPDYLYKAGDKVLLTENGTSFSIFLWIKPESLGTCPVIWGEHSQSDGMGFRLKDSGGNCYLNVWAPGGAVGDTSTPINASEWTFIGVTYNDTSDNVTFYVNGDEVADKSIENLVQNTGSDDITVCRWDHVGANYCDGIIDNLCAYKEAVGANHVSELFNGGAGRPCKVSYPEITVSSYNVTTAVHGTELALRTGGIANVTGTFTITGQSSESANYSISKVDGNYTNHTTDDTDTKCISVDTENFTCTPPPSMAPVEGLNTYYISTRGANGEKNSTSTSGPLVIRKVPTSDQESLARTAITNGINAVGGQTIFTDVNITHVLDNGTQTTGRFDKVAVGNGLIGINYATGGSDNPLSGMVNISSSICTYEDYNNSMNQVEAFAEAITNACG